MEPWKGGSRRLLWQGLLSYELLSFKLQVFVPFVIKQPSSLESLMD
jgi:hypothetical protein